MAARGPSSPFRSDILIGKVALITGGGTGICREIAWTLGKHGARLAIMGRRENVLKEACKVFTDHQMEACYVQG
jgi:2,4-dienoyl-CoA reductase [(3E)-enoyl-CoA-producing], peroxisomal